MTIGTRYRNDASGNDAATAYPYQFKIFAATDLRVIVRNTSTGIETVLTYPTHYTVSNVGNKNGGNVTLADVDGAWQNAADGTLKTGYDIAIRRQVSVEQDTDIRNQGSFHADTHEDEFDYLTMIDQQQEDKLGRALLLGESYDPTDFDLTLPAPDAGLCLAWNATEDGLVNVASPGALTVSGYISTLLDDADAGAAQTTLGISAFVKTLLDDASASALLDTMVANGTATTLLAKLTTEALSLPGDISPTQLAANTNNWAPTSLATASVIRFSTDASRNITGLTGGADGRVLLLMNVGSFPAVLTREDANSTAANRFAFASDITVQPNQGVHLWYDSTTARWRRLAGASKPSTVTVLTSGSGTYTTPTGATRLRVRLVGAGGSGSGSGTSAGAGSGGGNTTFSTLTGFGGGGGGNTGEGGTGGNASGGDINIQGQGGSQTDAGLTNQRGGGSGQSPFGGGGRQPNSGNGGGTAQTNSGSGGAGAGCGGTPNSGGGGAAGGYVEKLITNPAATYSYAVGGGASGGSAGTSGFTGGAGAAGIIVIEELYD
jgi:hypothetical protein